MRVYLPLTLPMLAAALAAGEVGCEIGYAVTPGLREWYAEGDQDELEYAALTAAARESIRLLAADPTAPQRRVVLAADIAEAPPRDAVERGTVALTDPIPMRKVAAAHVDDPEAMQDIAAAVAASAAADSGDNDAAFTVDETEAHELQWYATQELSALLE